MESNHPNSISDFSVYNKISRYHRPIAWSLILLTAVFSNSCLYFKSKSVDIPGLQSEIEKSRVIQHFIVHYLEDTYTLENFNVEEDKLTGNLVPLQKHVYFTPDRRNDFINNSDEKHVLHEVHIYLKSKFDPPAMGETSIPIYSLKEIKIINADVGKTILVATGTVVGLFALVIIIVLLTKSSCPYLYVHNGETFVFTGELYGGAIAQNLERDDYLKLPGIKPVNGDYKLMISNELKERQYTDLANLLVVRHSKEQSVLLDSHGKVNLFQDKFLPDYVLENNQLDKTALIGKTDNVTYGFDNENQAVNAIHIGFKNKNEAKKVNLLLKAKNALYFDYQMGKFWEKFGGSFDNWMERQAKLTTQEREQLGVERNIPLSVYVKKNGIWELVERLYTVGPMAYREMIVPIDLEGIESEAIELRIETGFKFWEIDELKLAYPVEEIPVVERLLPTVKGSDSLFAQQLAFTDNSYLAQEKTGDIAEVSFEALTAMEGYEYTVFLHTRGYYELVRDFTGLPQIGELKQFEDPNWLAEYARLQYVQTVTNMNIADISKVDQNTRLP